MPNAERETNAETVPEKPSPQALPSDRLSALSRRVTALEMEDREQAASPWSRASLLASLAVSLVSSLVFGVLYLAWTKIRSTP